MVVAAAAAPAVAGLQLAGLPKLWSLYAVRLALVGDCVAHAHTFVVCRPPLSVKPFLPPLILQGALSLATLAALRQAINARFGGLAGSCFLLITALQFHLPFYMSRTLPNVLALAVTNLAIADWVRGGRPRRVVALLTFATVSGRVGV